MKMTRVIGWTACAGLPLLNAAWAAPLEEMIVSVPLAPQSSQTAMPVTQLDRDQLVQQLSSNLGTMLASQPGIYNSSFGPGVGFPVIRGHSAKRVRVLQDGLGSGDLATLSPDHALMVEGVLADRVEILRGPATLLYGGGAIGGVVNVVDGRLPQTRSESTDWLLEQRYNDVADERVTVLRGDGGWDAWSWHLSAVDRDSDLMEIPVAAHQDAPEEDTGVLANSEAELREWVAGGSYQGERGLLALSVAHQEGLYGVPLGAHGHHEEEGHAAAHDEEARIRIDSQQTRWDAKWQWQLAEQGWHRLQGRLGYTDYQHRELELSDEGQQVGTRFDDRSWELRLEALYQSGQGDGVIGLQGQHRTFSAVGEEAFIEPSTIDQWALFALRNGEWQGRLWELGARWEGQQIDSDGGSFQHHSYSLSGSVLQPLGAGWQAGLSLSRSERAPTVEELLSNRGCDLQTEAGCVVHAATASVELGNPDLDNEHALNLELLLRYQQGEQRFELNLFENRLSDYLYLADMETALDEEVLGYRQEDARFRGLELQWQLPVWRDHGQQLDLTLFADRVRAYLVKGGNVPRMPNRRVGFQLDWGADPWSAFLRWSAVSEQTHLAEHEVASEGYHRVSLGGNWRFGAQHQHQAFITVHNALDQEIREASSFLKTIAPEAGRGVEVGLTLRF